MRRPAVARVSGGTLSPCAFACNMRAVRDLVARNDGIVRIFPIEPVQYRHFLPLLSSNSYNSVISCHQLTYFLPERYDYRAALGAGLLHSPDARSLFHHGRPMSFDYFSLMLRQPVG